MRIAGRKGFDRIAKIVGPVKSRSADGPPRASCCFLVPQGSGCFFRDCQRFVSARLCFVIYYLSVPASQKLVLFPKSSTFEFS